MSKTHNESVKTSLYRPDCMTGIGRSHVIKICETSRPNLFRVTIGLRRVGSGRIANCMIHVEAHVYTLQNERCLHEYCLAETNNTENECISKLDGYSPQLMSELSSMICIPQGIRKTLF